MNKERFLTVLDRQRKSGLSVKAFCRNEAYYPATFYYWKKKFCISDSDTSPSVAKTHSEDFAPVRFPELQSSFTTPATEDLAKVLNEIMIKLPTAIDIRFRGSCESESAMRLITQMCSGHVLPQ